MVSLFLGIILFYFILIIFIHRLYKNKYIYLFDWFLISIAFFNFLLYPLIIQLTKNGLNKIDIFSKVIEKINFLQISYFFILNIIFISFFILTYVYIKYILNKYNLRSIKIIKFHDKLIFEKKLKYTAWILFFISIVSYSLYTSAYGGFIKYLEYSSFIRSGVNVIDNPFSFMHAFGTFAFSSSYIFYFFIINKSNRKIYDYFGFFFSFIYSLLILYSYKGRVGFAVYLFTFLFTYLYSTLKSPFRTLKILTYFFVFLFAMIYFTNNLLKRTNFNIINLFVSEFSFPVVSFNNVVNNNNYRFFSDIILSPLYLAPSSFYSEILKIQTASSLNTQIFFGAKKGEVINGKRIYGELPLDLISFSYMQLNIIGVIIISILFGFFLSLLDFYLVKINIINLRNLLYAYLSLNLIIISIYYGDIQHILVRNFHFIVTVFLFILICKIKIIKLKK